MYILSILLFFQWIYLIIPFKSINSIKKCLVMLICHWPVPLTALHVKVPFHVPHVAAAKMGKFKTAKRAYRAIEYN